MVDLANGHIKAIEKLKNKVGVVTYNLGTGKGYSVFEIIESYKKASKKEIPYKIMPRRPGDIASCYADTSKAQRELEFKAVYGIDDMCSDSWRWQEMNINGYE